MKTMMGKKLCYLPLVLAIAGVSAQMSDPNGLLACLNNASIPTIIASDSLYAAAASTWNTHYQYHPAAMIAPTDSSQVASALVCASDNNIKAQPKSGGHSYASFSAGGADGSLVISLESFQDVSMDANNVAAIGGGQRLGNMAIALNDQGRALPHGSCPGVGIGGHATHGGYGYLSRAWGLTLDTIVGMDVALVNGSVAHVSATEDPDLFYALRGAADSIGVVTTFYMQTQPAPASILFFSYPFGPGILGSGTGDVAADMLSHIQDFALNASVVDERIGFGIYIDQGSFSLSGSFYGEQSEFDEKIKPELLRGLPIVQESLQVVDWRGLLDIFAEGQGPLIEPVGVGYQQHFDAFVKSLFSPEASPITHDAWLAYFNYIIQQGKLAAPATWYSILDLYGGPSSAVNAVPSSLTAFPDRSALFSFQHFGYTNDMSAPFPDSIQPFIEGLNAAIPDAMPGVPFGAYINYLDASLTAEEAHDVYYGQETYERLLGVKDRVDAGRVLWNPQAVGV